MSSEPVQYTSYLVRLWRQKTADWPTAAAADLPCYRADVEHIQSGQRHQFHSPADLCAFFQQLPPTAEYSEQGEK